MDIEERRKHLENIRIVSEVGFANSYTCYYLKSKGIKIYRGEERVCFNKDIDKGLYASHWKVILPPVCPKIYSNLYQKSSYVKVIRDLDLLNQLGVTISRNQEKERGWKLNYFLAKISKATYPVKKFPVGCQIYYDVPFRSLTLVGKRVRNNADTFLLEPEFKDPRKKAWVDSLDQKSKIEALFGIQQYEEKEEHSEIRIPELPIGYSKEDHSIVCIPKMMNPPVILLIGKMGTGKSISMNYLQGILREHEGWRAKCCFLNDVQFETDVWCRSMKHRRFINLLNFINLKPRPSPVVYLSPTNGQNQDDKKLEMNKEGVHWYISLDWKDICLYYNYIFSQNEALKLGKSGSYIDFEEFSGCRTEEELLDKIDKKFEEKEYGFETKKEVYGRVLRVIKKTIIKSRISSIGSSVSPKFYVRYGDEEATPMDPFSALMYAGCLPVLVTRQLQNVKLGDEDATVPYIKIIIKNILRMKSEYDYLAEDLVAVFIDELGQVLGRGANEPIEELFTLSRKEGIMPIAATHDYLSLPDKIKRNARYIFYFGKDMEEIAELKKRYPIDAFTMAELKNKIQVKATKEIECFIFHDEKSPLVSYDLYTGRRTEIDGKPVKIIPFPPMSNHKMEKISKERFGEGEDIEKEDGLDQS